MEEAIVAGEGGWHGTKDRNRLDVVSGTDMGLKFRRREGIREDRSVCELVGEVSDVEVGDNMENSANLGVANGMGG